MRYFIGRFVAVLIFAAPALPAMAQTADAETAPSPVVDYRRLDARLKRLSAGEDIMGLAVVVVEKGEIAFLKGYGRTHAAGDKVDSDTIFRWASVSKGVAGTLAGMLASENKLDLGRPIAEFSTSLRLPGGAHQRATLAHVLSHRVGLVSNAYDLRLEAGEDPVVLRAAFAGLKPLCAPGACFSYQNIAFDAASEALARAAGKPYAQLAQERLFGPLAMTRASLSSAGLALDANYARPHRRREAATGLEERPGKEAYYRVPAAGGVNSSIADMAEYLRAQMGLRPEVIGNAARAIAHQPLVETPQELRRQPRRGSVEATPPRVTTAHYGLGWRISDYAGRSLVGHRGAVEGYRALILFDDARDFGVAVLWNSGSGRPVGIANEAFDMAYGLPFVDWMALDPDMLGPYRPPIPVEPTPWRFPWPFTE